MEQEFRNKINEILSKPNLDNELRLQLEDLRDSLKGGLTKKEKYDIVLKWISIIKDVAIIYFTTPKN